MTETRIMSSRRFMLAVGVVFAASLLVWFGKIDGIAWGGAISVVCLGYYGNRALEKK